MSTGVIKKVAGPLVIAEGMRDANMFDVVRVSNQRLIGEIIEMHGDQASIQVYEETSGLGPGAVVETTGSLSVYPRFAARPATGGDLGLHRDDFIDAPPVVIVDQGRVLPDSLDYCGVSPVWLQKALEQEGGAPRSAAPAAEQPQMSLESLGEAEVLEAIRRCQPDTLTPIEAMSLLYQWKQKLS